MNKNNDPRRKMNMMKLMDKHHSDEACREILRQLRWPDSVNCPRCKSDHIRNSYTRDQFDCGSCGYQFSVTTGTSFHNSHIPLKKWFTAIYLMIESNKSISANQIKQTIDVSYKTAWYLCHRIRNAISNTPPNLLKSSVKVDDIFICGKPDVSGQDYRIINSGYKISVKHLDSYLNELRWRSDNRDNPYLFRDTLLKLLNSDNLEYKALTG